MLNRLLWINFELMRSLISLKNFWRRVLTTTLPMDDQSLST